MRFALIVALGLAFGPVTAQAQDAQTLADVRQELTVLNVEVQKLRRELSTTGGASVAVTGGSVLERVNAMESELQRLTSKTEELENRINRVVADGTNRIGDLEFRLVELEGGDLSKLKRVVKLTGDGFLVEFSTVQDAVNCAIELQQKLAASRLDFRMGINLGDIVDDGEDIHGEGVNVAARLEGLADPDGLQLSGI